MKKLFVTIACAVLAIGSMNAQDLSQATETYNNGATCLSSGDFEGALEAFQQAYTIASSLGEEGQEVADNCKNAIPEVSLNLAKSLAQNDDIDGAVARLNSTVELATEYGNQSVLDEAKALIPQLLLQKGNDLLNSKDYAGAAATYKQILEADSANGVAALRLGMALGRGEFLEVVRTREGEAALRRGSFAKPRRSRGAFLWAVRIEVADMRHPYLYSTRTHGFYQAPPAQMRAHL